MKILILGKGFIGTLLYKSLKKIYPDTVILSKSDLDYINSNELLKLLQNDHISYIINASGYTGVPNIDAAESNKKDCWFYNTIVPIKIAKAVSEHNAAWKYFKVKFIHISSGCIYNGYEKDFSEEDEPNFGILNEQSSFYSKTKSAAESILSVYESYCLRIRMPFCGLNSDRNYINKILQYDNLISMPNSVTCVEDFCEFVLKLILNGNVPFGVYNVVNEGSLTARDVVQCLLDYGIYNKNHKFIDLKELNTVASRSNCILSTEKIRKIGLELPPAFESLDKCIKKLSDKKL